MSRIYFHTPSTDAEIAGPERYWAGHVSTSFGLGALDLIAGSFGENAAYLYKALNPKPHGQGAEMVALSLKVDFENATFTTPDGKQHGAWHVLLNTCIDGGSDPIRLLARIHSQCEIHAWVDGPDRDWLAGVVEQGRASGIMREGMGWEALCVMLRERADEPVVMSYSVCDQFPNRTAADWKAPIVDGEPNYDAWYDLPEEERWSLAMAGLMGKNMQITPDNLSTYGFGTGLNAWQLLSALRTGK